LTSFAFHKQKKYKFNVLYIDGSIGFGGAVKSLSLTLRGLTKINKFILTSQKKEIIDKWYKDFKVYQFRRIINYRNQQRLTVWLEHKCSIAFMQIFILKTVALADLLLTLLYITRIILISKFHKIDIIHLNNYFLLEGIIAAKILKIPCLVHLRCFFEHKYDILSKSIKHVSHVIGVSNAVSTSIPSDQIPAYKVTTIYDPVDIGLFETAASKRDSVRKKLNLKDNDIAVGIFGRIVSWKGQLEFVHAALKAINLNDNLKAFIIGDISDGTSEYLCQIQSVINRSPVKDHFTLTGYQEDIEAYYCAMDIIVHASTAPEPFGMVVIEGMTAKKPVIATKAGGPLEVIDHETNGIFVEPGSVEEMSLKILDLVNNPSKRRQIGLNGFEMVQKRFSIETVASQVDNLYQKLLSELPRS